MDILELKKEIQELGITPETTYLYIQGHHLFDSLVTPLMIRICDMLHRERENEIANASIHLTQKSNELKAYNHSTADVVMMLRRNTQFKDAPPFGMIEKDIERILNNT